jgi:hypothetical protein
MRTANALAKTSLDNYRQSFKQEQRAYLWPSSFNASDGGPVIRDPKGNLRACADVHISNSGRTPAVGFYMTRLATYGEKTTPYVECDRKARDVIMSLKVPPYERPTGGMLGVTGDKWVRQQLISSTRPLSKKSLMANDPSTCTESFGISIFLGIITKPVFAVLNSQVARRTHLPTCLFGNWMDKRTR